MARKRRRKSDTKEQTAEWVPWKLDKEFVRDLVRLETGSPAGNANWRVGVLGFILIASLTVFTSVFETIARLFDAKYRSGTPYLELVSILFGGLMYCVTVLAIV